MRDFILIRKMAVQILSRHSSILFDRPFPVRLGVAELALNNNPGDPGLYFADNVTSPSTGLIKVGPTFIGSTAPNTPPAGYSLNSRGNRGWIHPVRTSINCLMVQVGKHHWQSYQIATGNRSALLTDSFIMIN